MQHTLVLKEKYEDLFFPDLVWPFFYECLYSFLTVWRQHYKYVKHSAGLRMVNVIYLLLGSPHLDFSLLQITTGI